MVDSEEQKIDNPYAEEIDEIIKDKLDKIAEGFINKDINELMDISSQIGKLRVKYSKNNDVMDMLEYLDYEVYFIIAKTPLVIEMISDIEVIFNSEHLIAI